MKLKKLPEHSICQSEYWTSITFVLSPIYKITLLRKNPKNKLKSVEKFDCYVFSDNYNSYIQASDKNLQNFVEIFKKMW